jgi:hypothetical protein
MSIQFQKAVSAQEIYKKVQERIEDAKLNYFLWKTIQKECERWEGKAISKRIETALKKILPDYIVVFENRYGMFQLYIWGNGINYDHRKQFLLGYETSPFFSAKQLLDSNMCHELEAGRAEKMATLTYTDIVDAADKWNNGLALMQEINTWAEPYELDYASNGFDIQR